MFQDWMLRQRANALNIGTQISLQVAKLHVPLVTNSLDKTKHSAFSLLFVLFAQIGQISAYPKFP